MSLKSDKALGTGVAAVDRAFAILNTVACQEGPIALAEIARKTGLYKSTILRLLISLEANGCVTRLRDGNYSLGPAAFRYGRSFERADSLKSHVPPVMRDLIDQGTESVSIHVRHDATTRLCLYRMDSNHSTLDRIRAGDLLPLRKGAAGRLLLAFDGEPGASYEALRKACFALSSGEREKDCSGMACPIFAADGGIKAAISLSGPGERFTAGNIQKMKLLLGRAARDLTSKLGGAYPKV